MKVIISRTDKIGDVLLTLPLAGVLKERIPGSEILFLGNSYTEAVIVRSGYIDTFLNWDQLKREGKLPEADHILHVFPNREVAKAAVCSKIPHRSGTSHRLFHWWTCNHLIHFTRKGSSLHEAQLNTKLLKPLGISSDFALGDLHTYLGWQKNELPESKHLLTNKFNLIFHMKSRGSAKEWPLLQYLEVARQLPSDNVQIFVSGTADEGAIIWQEIPEIFDLPYVTDITGKFTLSQFISFIEQADGLLACSTGPLHIASSAGIKCLGLYPAQHPIHAGRWAPIGKMSSHISETTTSHSPYLNIGTSEVLSRLHRMLTL